MVKLSPQDLARLRVKRTKAFHFKFPKGEIDHSEYNVRNAEANKETLRLLSSALKPKKEIQDLHLNYTW